MSALPTDVISPARRYLCERAAKDFRVFERLMHPQVSGEPYVKARHLDALAWKLEQVARGEVKRLLVAAPPRHFKSYQASVAFPAFLLGQDPSLKIVCASYGSHLASEFANQSRRILLSSRYQAIFPETRLTSRTPPVDTLRTSANGYRYASSIGGPLTGMGADVMILDDPLKASEATSQIARDAAFDWLTGTAMTRFDKPAEGVLIVVMQRLHQDDPIGRLQAEGGWELLELPAEAMTSLTLATGPKVSFTMTPGDILFPERFDEKILAERRRELGEAAFSAQYLQRPTPAGGHLFKMKEFRRFDRNQNNRKDQYEAVIFSMDNAISTAQTSDFTAFTVWGVRGEELYLLKADRGRWDFARQLDVLREWREKVDILIVERSQIGIALMQQLSRELGTEDKLHGYTPKVEKLVRAEYAATFAAKGNVLLPEQAPWLEMVEQELSGFPHARNDDLVDSFSQLVHILVGQGAPRWFGLKAFKPKLPEVRGYLLG